MSDNITGNNAMRVYIENMSAITADFLPLVGGTMTGVIADLIDRPKTTTVSTTGITYTISDMNNLRYLELTLEHDITFDISVTGLLNGDSILITFTQGVSNHTVVWDGLINWGDAGSPVLKNTTGDIDLFSFMYVNGEFLATHKGGFAS